MSHLKICIPQITISPPLKQSSRTPSDDSSFSSSSIFDKEMIFQSISVEFNRLHLPVPMVDGFYRSIVTAPFSALIINPFHTNLHLTISEEESEYSSFLLTYMPTKAYYRSVMIIQVGNLDVSPNLSQLSHLQDTLFYLQNSSRKYRSQLLRPRQRPSLSPNNISSWWRYALVGTMIERNGDSCFFPRNHFNIGFITEVSKEQRSRYVHIYSQVLRDEDHFSRRGDASDRNVSRLTEEELRSLESMHSEIGWGSLLIFRLMAHKKTQAMATDLLPSNSSLPNSTVLLSSLLSVFASPYSSQKTNSRSSTPPALDIETEFKILYRDIRHSLQELSSFNIFPIDFTAVFSRFALSLDSNDRLTRTVTIILYGFLWNCHQNFLSGDGLAHIRLGALRIFGKDGTPLISCGDYTDEWFHSYDIQSSTTRTLAFSFQYQWFTQIKRSVLYTFPSESNPAKPGIASTPHSSKLGHGIKHRGIVEMSCNILRIINDSDSIQQIFNLYSVLDGRSNSSPSSQFDLTTSNMKEKSNLNKVTPIFCARMKRKHLLSTFRPFTMNSATKWSISATLAGLTLELPLKSSLFRTSGRVQKHSGDSFSSMIQVSIGFCSIYSGDFLMGLEIFKSMNTAASSSSLFPVSGIDPPRNLFPSDSTLQYSSDSLPELKENRYYEEMFYGVWANRDKILQSKIRKQVGGVLMQHCVCTIHSFEIKGHFPHHQSSYTEVPINLQLLFTWSSELSPHASVLAIDLLSSSTHLSLRNEVSSLFPVPFIYLLICPRTSSDSLNLLRRFLSLPSTISLISCSQLLSD